LTGGVFSGQPPINYIKANAAEVLSDITDPRRPLDGVAGFKRDRHRPIKRAAF